MTTRTIAIGVGILMLLATASYIPGGLMVDSVLTKSDYLTQVYPDRAQIIIGVLLEYVDAIAVFGIGMLLFPILKARNETVAITYASTRVFEAVLLAVAGVATLSLIELSKTATGASAQDIVTPQAAGDMIIAQSSLAFYVAMIGLGLGSLPFCNLLYRSKLVPGWMAILGFVGYVALFASGLFGLFDNESDLVGVLFIPGAIFEIIFPLWLIVKGFNAEALPAESAPVAIPS
jgi:hypothetical protein